MRFRIGLALCAMLSVCAWLSPRAPTHCEVNPVAETILTQQRLYFQSIASLDLHQVVTIAVNQALRDVQGKHSSAGRQEGWIVIDGARYFSEVKVNQDSTIYSAFDGNDYQALTGSMLVISKSPRSRNPYHGWTVLTAPFVFAFAGDDELSIDALRNPDLWGRRLQEVVEVSETTMLGHTGTLLKFAPTATPNKTVEAFFADDLHQLPIYVKLTFENTISEMTVLDTKTVTTNGVDLVIPTRVRANDYSSDRVYEQVCVLEADSETLEVNQPVNQDRFTLPRTNVK